MRWLAERINYSPDDQQNEEGRLAVAVNKNHYRFTSGKLITSAVQV